MSYDEHLISQAGGDGDMLDQIQRRADKATPGPWESKPYRIGFGGDPEREPDFWEIGDSIIHELRDAEFIANARTDVPALLALVREQQARIDRVRSMLATWDEVGGDQNISVNFAVTRLRAALEES